jgi:hypothetical protein
LGRANDKSCLSYRLQPRFCLRAHSRPSFEDLVIAAIEQAERKGKLLPLSVNDKRMLFMRLQERRKKRGFAGREHENWPNSPDKRKEAALHQNDLATVDLIGRDETAGLRNDAFQNAAGIYFAAWDKTFDARWEDFRTCLERIRQPDHCGLPGTMAWPVSPRSGQQCRPHAILDGEIVHPGPDGRSMFYELMRRRGPFCFYAFDLLWLDGKDLRDRTLLERKGLLRNLLPRRAQSALYLEHVESGSDLFRVILIFSQVVASGVYFGVRLLRDNVLHIALADGGSRRTASRRTLRSRVIRGRILNHSPRTSTRITRPSRPDGYRPNCRKPPNATGCRTTSVSNCTGTR